MSKPLLLLFVLVSVGFISSGAPSKARGQTLTTGALEGRVLDQTTKQPVASATISVKNQISGLERSALSESSGEFSFNILPAGFYTLRCSAEGYDDDVKTNVPVRIGQVQRMEFRLTPKSVPSAAPPAETGSSRANSDPLYTRLRNLRLSGENALVENLVLKREVATITLRQGTLHFLDPVENRITGAVFIGEGDLVMNPTAREEQRQLSLLTGAPFITEHFRQMVLRFTDSTYDDVKKEVTVKSETPDPKAQRILDDHRKLLRRGRSYSNPNIATSFVKYNLDTRLLTDLTWANRGGLFQAYFRGSRYGEILYDIDPLGAPAVTPEEVVLAGLDDSTLGIWYASHLQNHFRSPASTDEDHRLIDIEHYSIETTLKGRRMEAVVTARFASLVDGARVLSFDLFPRLRVRSVTDARNHELNFIQEKEDEDASFAVILPEELKKGGHYSLTFAYAGNDAVSDAGGGNYTLEARENWYPAGALGDRATYEITIRAPKGAMTVATGQPAGESKENEYAVTRWKTDVPISVAGFNYGRYKKTVSKDEKLKYVVEAYANTDLPDYLKGFDVFDDVQFGGGDIDTGDVGTSEFVGFLANLGSLNTVKGIDRSRLEAQLAVQLYSEMFGPLPYGRLAMTQQPYFSFAQSWPMLVYMPVSAYLDSTHRHQLGIDAGDSFFKIVGPHEVAHQWWGNIVGWKSYRDRWMSEGLAHLSASLFAQYVYRNELFRSFWKEQRKLVLTKNQFGKRPSDLGGVAMGDRLNTAKTGDVSPAILYAKGAFIFHMLRMMMWNPRTHDDLFKGMMKDFVNSHYNTNASVQDFQHIVERHMTPEMDLDGNGKMDWFFHEWVYGTSIPEYKLDYRVEDAGSGKTKLVARVTQSNVDDSFKMRLPIYLEVDGKVRRLGALNIVGNSTEEISAPLPKRPRKVILCYYEDVLCTIRDR